MKKLTEGRRMWFLVMVVFLFYAIVFIVFEDYDRNNVLPFNEVSDWHLLLFSIVVMTGLGWLLHGYSKSMDQRITNEQQQKQNQMRRELTQNIAHELKTPVASILGYTDTLIQNPNISDEKKQQFIARTNFQAKRLSALLCDISTITKIDYAPQTLVFERVNISQIVADIALEIEQTLKQKNMIFKNCLSQNICIKGNYDLIYSIFRNLVENSLNYAGDNTFIELSDEKDEFFWHFRFQDNGCGVAKEHLPRIFERFYRIDKSRSRSTGGTGLGLSIVKNAVLFHGGTISANTKSTGGLYFDFTLKI